MNDVKLAKKYLAELLEAKQALLAQIGGVDKRAYLRAT